MKYLYRSITGAYISWVWLSVVSAVFPVLLIVCVFFIPETPNYLVRNGKLEEASRALKWLRGASTTREVEPELRMVSY